MRWVTAHQKTFQIHDRFDAVAEKRSAGFKESITSRAVHELLFHPMPGNVFPLFPALLAVHAFVSAADADFFSDLHHRLAWIDSTGAFYPPAAVASGISPGQIYVLRPRPGDLVWATIESLRCRGISAVVALMMQPLTRVEVRRLQLAAETGGGIAVLIRPNIASAASHIYAAATRWLVTPTPGERLIQRWRLQRIHGQGRQIDQSFILEKHRATGQSHFVHPPAALADHPAISAAS